jgi:tetratricopeptide (TPR) repeat protein
MYRVVKYRRALLATSLTLFYPSLATCQLSLSPAQQSLAQGDYAKGIEQLQGIVRAEPGNAEAHSLLGTALATEERRRESLDELLEAARLKPNSAVIYERLGLVMSHFSETAAARQAFEKAVSLDPNRSNARLNLAMLSAQAGDYATAARQLDFLHQITNSSIRMPLVRYLRAKIYDDVFDFDKAIAELKLALKADPSFADAWFELGVAQRALQNNSPALEAFEQAAKLNPEDFDTQYQLGTQALRTGNFSEAIAHLQEADHLRPHDRPTLYNLARALRKAGNAQEAHSVTASVAALTKTADKTAENALAAVELNNAGVELEKKGELRAALEKYRAAEDLDPQHPGFRLNHGLVLCRLGFWNQGIAELRDVSKENPENVEASRDLSIAADQFRSSKTHVGNNSK